MKTDILDTFEAAWHSATQRSHLPTLASLEAKGVSIEQDGFALIGRSVDPSTKQPRPMFRMLQAGKSHELYGGYQALGQPIDEILHPAHLAGITKLYASIADSGQPHRWRCLNMARNAPPLSYARIIAPIDDDIGDGRCLAGMWIWEEDHTAAQAA